MKEPKIIATAAICTAALSGGFVFTQGPTKFDANEVYASVYQETNVMADEEIVEVVEEEVVEEVETEVESTEEESVDKNTTEEVKTNKKPVVSKPNKTNKPVKPQVQQSKPIQQPSQEPTDKPIDKVEVNQESVNNQTEIPSQQPSEETTDKPIDKVEDNQESVDNSTDKPDQPNDNLQENPILEVDQTTDVENTSIDSVEEQVDGITE